MITRSIFSSRARLARRPTFGALIGLALVAAACGTTEATGPLQPSGETGRVRFVNVITDVTRGLVRGSPVRSRFSDAHAFVARFGGRFATAVGSPSCWLSAIASATKRRIVWGSIRSPSCNSSVAISYFPPGFNRGSISRNRWPRQNPNSTRSSSARMSRAGPFEK